jgi:hypothetical protein
MSKHIFIHKEIEAGTDFVIESCVCGQRRKRFASTRITWEQADGSFTGRHTECYGAYANPVKPTPPIYGTPPMIEAIAIIRLLIEDRPKGERCAKNFLSSYA